MAALFATIKFWSLKDGLQIKDSDIGCSAYHDKFESGGDQLYYEDRKIYSENRGFNWVLTNKRPEKLREAVKELEEVCLGNRCIIVEWSSQSTIQATFSNGLLAYIYVNTVTGDIQKISFDKYLIGKLHSDHIVDIVSDNSSMIFSYVEPKLTSIQLSRKISSPENLKKIEKLNTFDPKISAIDVVGPAGRRLERKLSQSINKEYLLVWWRVSSNEVWPWTPLNTEKERANLQVYDMNSPKVELTCFCRTEMEPLLATFSKIHVHHIITIEQRMSHTGEIAIERCSYEVTLTKQLQRVATTSVPLKSQAICVEHNSQEDRLLIGCEDCSLVMYDDYRRITQTTKLAFVPSLISWHPNDAVVLVGSEQGQIQCFDQALSFIKIQLQSEQELTSIPHLDLAGYFKYQPTLKAIVWKPSQSTFSFTPSNPLAVDQVIIVFDRGPFAMIQFQLGMLSRSLLSPAELIAQYIKCRQLDEAVNLLSSLNWNVDGQLCLYCLTLIVNHLLRMPFTPAIDAQLESALGTFYAPIRPLTKVTILEYRDPIGNIARKFFHHLLRHQKLEKASLLAVDIGSRDLFRDLYYVAVDKGEDTFAELALRNAKELEESAIISDESHDYVNDSETSDYSDSSYSSDYSDANHNRRRPQISRAAVTPTRNALPALSKSQTQPKSNHDFQISLTQQSHQSQVLTSTEQTIPAFSLNARTQIQSSILKSSSCVPTTNVPHSSVSIKSAKIVPTSLERQLPVPPMQRVTAHKAIVINDSNSADHKKMSPYYNQLTESADFSLLSLQPEESDSSVAIDPNEEFVDGDTFLPGDSDEDEETTGKVKVVHFGIV